MCLPTFILNGYFIHNGNTQRIIEHGVEGLPTDSCCVLLLTERPQSAVGSFPGRRRTRVRKTSFRPDLTSPLPRPHPGNVARVPHVTQGQRAVPGDDQPRPGPPAGHGGKEAAGESLCTQHRRHGYDCREMKRARTHSELRSTSEMLSLLPLII